MWPYEPAPWTTIMPVGSVAAASSRARRERSGPRRVRYFDFTVITEPPSFMRSMGGVRDAGGGLKACIPGTAGAGACRPPLRYPLIMIVCARPHANRVWLPGDAGPRAGLPVLLALRDAGREAAADPRLRRPCGGRGRAAEGRRVPGGVHAAGERGGPPAAGVRGAPRHGRARGGGAHY